MAARVLMIAVVVVAVALFVGFVITTVLDHH